MVRWLPRILVLVTLVGLLAMHGLDATATAAHEPDAVTPAPAHGSHDGTAMPGATAVDRAAGARTGSQQHRGLQHVAVACMFALVTVAVLGVRRLLVTLARRAIALTQVSTTSLAGRLEPILHPPQPAWVRLCVIRH